MTCTTKDQDRSMTVQEYRDLGVPDLNSKWQSNEIARCLDVLAQLKSKDFYSLPRKGSAKSGKVYEKLTSLENEILYTDPVQANRVLSNLVEIYNDPDYYRNPGYYHHEFTGVIVYMINFSYKNVEVLNSLQPFQLEFESTKTQISLMESGYSKMLSGFFFFQNDSIHLNIDDQILLSETFTTSLDTCWPILSENSVEELLPRIQGFASNHRSKEVRDKYTSLLKSKGLSTQ
jgi:hypothetical protein